MANVEEQVKKLVAKTISAMSDEEFAEFLTEIDSETAEKILSTLPKDAMGE